MAFSLITVTLTEFKERFPRDPVVQSATPVQFDAWLLETEEYIDEDSWGAQKGKTGVLYACAHFARVEDRAQSKAGRVGATTNTTTETISESTSIPNTGQTRDNIWHTTIYGQGFIRLRSTITESFIPLPDITDEDGNLLRGDKVTGGLSSWRHGHREDLCDGV